MKKILFVCMAMASSFSFVWGFDLQFPDFQSGDPIQNKFSLVHFTLPNNTANDYQGAFFWLPSLQKVPAETVVFNGVTKSCSKQVRGIYYTNAQGGRLWPLDQQSLAGLKLMNSNYTNLQINGALYTTCGSSGSTDIYSIYGQITYSKGGATLGTLTAGLMYDDATNKPKTSLGLYPSFQYFNNQTPLGYIYDSVAGVGFVGGELSAEGHDAVLTALEGGDSINDLFGYGHTQNDIDASINGQTYSITEGVYAGLDTLRNISVLGNVLLSRGGLDARDRQSVLGNPSLSSAVVFSDIVNTSDILNSLRKNADALCRGEKKYPLVEEDEELSATFIEQYMPSNQRPVLCITNDQGGTTYQAGQNPLIINLSQLEQYADVDIVVQGRNVVLSGSVPSKGDAINLFVDNGNVYLNNVSFLHEIHDAPEQVGVLGNYGVFDNEGALITQYPGGKAHLLLQQLSGNPSYVQVTSEPDRPNNVPLSTRYIYESLRSLGGTGVNGVGKVSYGTYIRGNIFVNGIVAGYNPVTKGPAATDNKYYFHGRLASLNTALTQSANRDVFMTNIFGESAATTTLLSYVDFSKVFLWQCQIHGFASDGAGNTTLQPCMQASDVFKFSPFVLINTPIATKLLQ